MNQAFLIFANGFEPKYNIFNKGDKIIVRVEAPGNCNLESKIEILEKRKKTKNQKIQKKIFLIQEKEVIILWKFP